ncbi:uncharacterized protein LOC122204620 [Panthera leo]|uniref:uncharacterized protein LOC122204620 n=1 Tax=Panthera leo TaxID=9689 RepID=UPI001C69D2DB|nr:uncharacterized protein LOC122204620 [Panthera leo]
MAQRVFTSELGRLTHETWTQTSVAALSTSPAWNRPSSRPREKETQSGLRGLEEEEAARSHPSPQRHVYGLLVVHVPSPTPVTGPGSPWAEGRLTGAAKLGPEEKDDRLGTLVWEGPSGHVGMMDGKEFGAQAPGTDGRFAGDSTDALAAGPPRGGCGAPLSSRGRPETQSPALASPGPPARPGAGTQAQAAGAFSTRSAPSARGVRDGLLVAAGLLPSRRSGRRLRITPGSRAQSPQPTPQRATPCVLRTPGYHVPLNRGSAFCFQRRGAAAMGRVERETSRRATEETNGHLKGQERGRERDHETAEWDTADTGRSSPGSPREFQRLGPSAPNRDSAENTHLRVRVRPCAACPHRAGPPATRFAPPPHCGPSLHNKGYSF